MNLKGLNKQALSKVKTSVFLIKLLTKLRRFAAHKSWSALKTSKNQRKLLKVKKVYFQAVSGLYNKLKMIVLV